MLVTYEPYFFVLLLGFLDFVTFAFVIVIEVILISSDGIVNF